MNIVPLGEGACEKIRRYLDSYISNELLVETNHEVLRHLEHCLSCSAELEARTRLRSRLKSAVEREDVPPDLRVRVRARIQAQGSRPPWMFAWTRWAASAAAVVAVIGIWSIAPRESLPALGDRPAQARYIQRISQKIPAAFSAGLKDHVHCAVFRKYPSHPPSLDQMAAAMGPSYSGLLQLVKSSVPGDYRIVMAHRCAYMGRRYMHLTLQNGAHLVSLVIALRQDGETLRELAPSLRPSDIPVYQSAASRFEVAAFGAGPYLAFVISDLPGGGNLQLAGSLAPAVHRFLAAVEKPEV